MNKVRISTTNGHLVRKVKGYAYGEWLAHEAHDSVGWRISHAPTGLGTYSVVDALSKDEARRIAKRLATRVPRLRIVGGFGAFLKNAHRYADFDANEFRFIFEAIVAEELMS